VLLCEKYHVSSVEDIADISIPHYCIKCIDQYTVLDVNLRNLKASIPQFFIHYHWTIYPLDHTSFATAVIQFVLLSGQCCSLNWVLPCRSVSGKKLCSSCGHPLGKGAAMIIETLGLYFHIQCFKVSVTQADCVKSEPFHHTTTVSMRLR
jgi:hypothetical protein